MTWSSRRVLVTGADGFIGSHLTEALVEAGATVRTLCFYNSFGSLGWLDKVEPEVRGALDVRLGDIRDARFVEECCQEVDVVFHLAALISIPYSYQAPESFVDTNVRGTLNVLEAVRRARCARLVHTSTSEVYGTPETVPIRESHPLRAQSPYSATKIAAEKLCEAFRCAYEIPVVILRPFNTFGPRQSIRAVIPTILLQLLRQAPEVRLGNLEPRRDLTFVSDTVAGFLAAGTVAGIEGETIHLGTGRAESVRDIVAVAQRVCERDARVVVCPERVRPRHSEVMVLQSDPSRASKMLGWKAKVSLEDGLCSTAEWLRTYMDRFGVDYAI